MEILTDTDESNFSSETLSLSQISSEGSSVSRGDSHSREGLVRRAESFNGTGTSETERESTSKSDDYERVTSMQSAQSSCVSLSGETSSTSSSYDNDGKPSQNPADDFLRQCYQAVQRSRQTETRVSKAEMTSRCISPKTDVVEFCTKCIRVLQSDRDLRNPGVCSEEPIKGLTSSNIAICPSVLERLKIERLLHSMRKVTGPPEYNSLQDCPTCRDVKKKIDERTFIQNSISHLRNQLTKEKLQKHLVEMDPVSCIGSLAAGLPRMRDPPEEIWKKLLDR